MHWPQRWLENIIQFMIHMKGIDSVPCPSVKTHVLCITPTSQTATVNDEDAKVKMMPDKMSYSI